MTEFNKEQSLARYIALWERRHAEFDQLPDVKRRVARGDYDFFSNVDIELDELQQEANHHGFYLNSAWDGSDLVYTIEPMSQSEHAAYLMEEQEETC